MTFYFKVATVKMVDKFSFPSGHATRATMLALLFTLLSPLPFLLWIPFLAWAGAVAVSRVLLGRHHILDVVAGVVIGAAEAVILSMLWRSEEEVGSDIYLNLKLVSAVYRRPHWSMLHLDLRIPGQVVRLLPSKRS